VEALLERPKTELVQVPTQRIVVSFTPFGPDHHRGACPATLSMTNLRAVRARLHFDGTLFSDDIRTLCLYLTSTELRGL